LTLRTAGTLSLLALLLVADIWYINVRLRHGGNFVPSDAHAEGGVYTMMTFLIVAIGHGLLAEHLWRVYKKQPFTTFDRAVCVVLLFSLMIIYVPTNIWSTAVKAFDTRQHSRPGGRRGPS
jgi:hypothetical protein